MLDHAQIVWRGGRDLDTSSAGCHFAIAICVCTAGRPHTLRRLLESLRRIELGRLRARDVALFIVDNRPDGSALRVVQSECRGFPLAIRFLEERKPGISHARNVAVAAALGSGAEHIAFIDDDDLPEPGWLWALVQRQHETGAAVVFGTWKLSGDAQLSPSLARVRWLKPPRVDDVNRFGLPGWAGSYNVLLSRAVLEGIGHAGVVFRPEYSLTGGEDTDLFVRAHRAGYSHDVASQSVVIRVIDRDRKSVQSVIRRGFMFGTSSYLLAKAHLAVPQLRRFRRHAGWSMAKGLVTLPTLLVRRYLLLQWLARMSRDTGVVYASFGGRYNYYRVTETDPAETS